LRSLPASLSRTGPLCLLLLGLLVFGPAPSAGPHAAEAPLTGPYGLWDPHRRPEKPDLKSIRQIRFLTEDDFPPFDFEGASGALEGFNVDLARAICRQLKTPCTIQARRWDTIVAALEEGQADVIAASLVPSAEARGRLQFSRPYYLRPARFVVRKGAGPAKLSPQDLAGRSIGVVAGTAHEAYARAYLTAAHLVSLPSEAALRAALKNSQVDLIFGDGIGLSLWLNGTDAGGCCGFAGSPFFDSHFFGDGIGMAMRREDGDLRQAVDYALFQIWEQGLYADIVRRWFPVDPFARAP
jgi:polar amino acid transport system substrate-binding protein